MGNISEFYRKDKVNDMQIDMGFHVIGGNKISKEEFEEVMRKHAKWLEDHKNGKCADFSYCDLSGMDLSRADLSCARLKGTNLMEANLSEVNLTFADLDRAFLHGADLSRAKVDNTDFSGADLCTAKLDECKGENTRFNCACMWECSFKNVELTKAEFMSAQVCDCDFTGAILKETCFIYSDMDNAVFRNALLENSIFDYADRVFWSDFSGAEMTGVSARDVSFDPYFIKNAKNLILPIYCPEEGSFIGWKMCKENRVVKLRIPEHAKRDGNTLHSLRASEVEVLEIYDKDGNPVNEAVSQTNENFCYVKGEKAIAKVFDESSPHLITGIYFVLSRADTEYYREEDK